MKYTFLILLTLFCVFADAQQITITSGDMASLNDTVRFSTSITDVSAMLNDTGANHTWNFSNLVPDFQDIVKFKTANSISQGYAQTFSSSSYGTQDPDINFTLASATNVYTFYKNSAASYVADGRGLTVNGLPLTQTYGSKDVIYRFPLHYGDRDTSSYVSNEVSVLIANVVSAGHRINVVDGWGLLITPYGTFDCIRIKSTVQETDTIKITTPFAISIPLPNNKTEYKWIANGKKIPILEIDIPSGGLGGATTIKYRDIYRAEAFQGLADFSANKTLFAVSTAGSGDTCILTSSSLNNPKAFLWTITPNTFTYGPGSTATSASPKIVFNANGNYTISLKVTYNAGTADTTKLDYITVAQGPVANFGSSITGSVSPLTVVSFYDSSTGTPMPTDWKWTFFPNTVSFVGGTSSTSQNPKITFDIASNYAVSLRVTNTVGSNTVTKYFGVFNAGVNEMQQDHQAVIVYPNPADQYVEMNVSRNTIDHLEIFDITGKSHQLNYKWNGQKSCTIDCSQLNRGIYFVKIIYTDKQTAVAKISVR